MADYVDQEMFERFGFRCVYCGFDGRSFDNWMQLTTDHIVPKSQGGADSPENKVLACHFCNTLTCRYVPDPNMSRNAVLAKKQEIVAARRDEYFRLWLAAVAPKWLKEVKPASFRAGGVG